MSSIFANAWVVALLVGSSVFLISYLWADRVWIFFQARTAGTQSEVLATLKRMLIEVDERQINRLLILCSYGLGAIFFLLAWPNLVAGFLFGLIFTLIGLMLPKMIVQNMWETRCNRLVNQMVDGLTLMANGIRAGQSITQAMERVVQSMKGPFPQELALILNKTQLGMSVEDAIAEFAERIPRPDVQMLATAIIVLKETGGNLADTFSTIVITIRERQKVEKKIQALTTQGSTQAIIITLVPFVLIALFLVVDPNYILPLFTKPLGWFFLFIMITLQTIGLLTMKKIVTIKV